MHKSTIRHIETDVSSELAEFALQHAVDCIYWILPDASFFYVNNAACDMLGYTRDELLTMKIFDIDPLVSRKLWKEHWQKIRTDKYFRTESQHRTKDGRLLDIEIRANYLQFNGGEYNCAIVRDITQRKQTEELLRLESAMLTNLSEGIHVVRGSDYKIVYANTQVERMFGYGPGGLLGKHVSVLNAPTDISPEQTTEEIITALNERGVWTGEVKNIRKDGTTFWSSANVSRFNHSGFGTVWLSIQRDITAQKESVQALKESEERYRTLIEHSPYCIHEIDRDGKIISMNPAGLQMAGKETELDIIGLDYLGAVSKPDRPGITKLLDSAINGAASEFEFTAVNGRYYQSSFVPISREDGHVQRVMGITIDITESKQAQSALDNSVSLLNATMESTADGILVVNREGRIVNFNQHFVQLWKIPRAIIDTRDDNQALAFVLHQLKEPDRFLNKVRELYNQPEAESFDLLEFRDGRVFERYSQPQRLGNEVVGRVWSFRDITQRRLDEEALRTSEELFRNAMHYSPIGMALVAPDGHWLEVNHALCQIVGYAQEEMRTMDFQTITHPDDLDADLEYVRAMLNREIETYQMEKRYLHKDGHIVWVLLSVSLLWRKEGTPHFFIAQIQDITRRKETEENLLKAQNMLQSVLDTIPVRVFWKDTESRYLGCNTPFARDCGLQAPEEIIGKDDFALPWVAHAEKYITEDREIISTGASRIGDEKKLLRPDGSHAWLRSSKIPLKNKDGKIFGILGTYEDITESKKLENALRESEEKFYKAFNSSPDSMVINRLADGRLINVNESFERLLGYSRAEAIGKTPIELNIWVQPQERERYTSLLKKDNSVRDFEVTIRRKDGAVRIHRLSAETFMLNGEPCIVSVGTDITDHKIEQLNLQRSMRALRVLSSCNEAVTKITDERELLESVCRIAVEQGNYRFAWVGYPRDDAIKTVLPMAHAGHEGGYLKNLITWAVDDKRGRGPTGKSLRTRSNVVVRSTATDPIFQPWREEALQRGYASSVALPLVAGQDVIGALMIYASEDNAFDEEEVNLLTELAGNLAMGVHNLRIAKSLEKIRQEADRQYRELDLLYNTAPIGCALIDRELRFVRVNKVLADAHNLSVADHYGRTVRDIKPDLAPVLEPIYKQVLASGESILNREIREELPGNGGVRYWLGHFVPLKVAGGEIVGLNLMLQDITERKRIGEELHIQERVLEAAINPVLICDAGEDDNPIIYCNPAFERVSGYAKKEVLGKNPRFLQGNDREQPGLKVVRKAIAKGMEARVLMRNYRRDGSLYWNELHLAPVKDGNGNVTHWIGIHNDITQRKLHEQALSESEDKFSKAFRSLPDPLVIARIDDGAIIDVNDSYLTISGHQRAEVIGKSIFEFGISKNSAQRTSIISTLIKHGSVRHVEADLVKKDERTAHCLISGETIWINNVPHMLLLFRDITQQKQVEEALKHNEKLLRFLYEENPSMYFTVTPAGAIQSVNSFGARELGYTVEELTGQPVFTVFRPDDHAQVQQHLSSCLMQPGNVFEWEVMKVCRDGRQIWVKETAVASKSPEGEMVILIVCRDITRRKQVEENLRFAQFSLDRAADYIYWTGPEGNFIYVNDALVSALGYNRRELLSMNIQYINPMHKYKKLLEKRWDLLRKEKVLNYETQFLAKNGLFIPVEITAYYLCYDEKEFNCAIARDITERKRAQELLQKNQRILTEAQRVARLGSWELNLADNKVTWSDEVLQIFEIDKNIFAGSYEAFLALVHPDDREFVDKSYRKSLLNKSGFDIVHRLQMEDGRIKYVNEKCETEYNKKGEAVRSVGTVLDVTRSVLTQKELEERADQQNFVAELGKLALAETEMDAIFKTAVTGLANILDVEYAKILELLPDGQKLLLRSGTGWHQGLVGAAEVSAGLDSQAGYTLKQNQVVIVRDLRTESRFKGPQLLTEHGVISGLSVVIQGTDQPFGVLGAHTGSYREFSQNDIDFIQSIAYVLAETINRSHARNTILQSREELRSLTQRLQTIREEERTKISRKIHDDLGQRLTALKMDLSWIGRLVPRQNKKLTERLDAVISLTDSTLDITRKIALELRPAILDDLGLVPAIEQELQHFSQRTNCSYKLNLQNVNIKLDRKQTITIFRILQEALTNIIRHANATHVDITLTHDEDKVLLFISDNGVGIHLDKLTDKNSLGIMSMRERAGALDGMIRIENGKHGGTIISLEMPVT